jgi:hypothetical protein
VETSNNQNNAIGNDNVFQLILFNQDGVVNYRLHWFIEDPTQQQRFDVAMAVDRVMRSESDRFKAASAAVNEAALLGYKVNDYPLLRDFVAHTIFIREADDLSGIG